MSKRQILIVVAILLIITGTVIMVIFKDKSYNYLLGGGIIGAGFGLIPALYSKKNK